MADAQNANTYIEVISTGSGELRLANSYIEVVSAGGGELRLAVGYVEALIPAKPDFVGWGVPLSSGT